MKKHIPENDVKNETRKKYFPGKPESDFIIDPPLQPERLFNKVYTETV